MGVVFVFLDGVGLAPSGPDNPLTDAATPTLRGLLGGPLTAEAAQRRAGLLLAPIDATLGVPGLPQSGTGHVALLAGVNAAALHGRHQPHSPPVALRPLLAEQSVLRRVASSGGRVAFANAFAPAYWQALAARKLRRSASVIAAEGAGLRFRDTDDLAAGRALAWDITGATMRAQGLPAPPLAPAQAGFNLARLAAEHDLVFFECFLPDLAGHGRADVDVPGAFARIDGMLGALLAGLPHSHTLLITSDHGNAESRAAPAHTRNPVPLLACGPAADAFADVGDIAGVAAALERATAPGRRT